jgi:hypothetical protein
MPNEIAIEIDNQNDIQKNHNISNLNISNHN